MSERRHIIYGVLNWGLGHATRSVTVIKALLKEGYIPVIASDGLALEYLKKEFPDLNFEELPSYRITYGKRSFVWGILKKIPFMIRAVKGENKQLKKLIVRYQAVGVISDNRLGFYSRKVPSVYITHQLKIFLLWPLSFIINKIHHCFIEKYRECWVPDFLGQGLAGELSHSSERGKNIKYTGPLSRFSLFENQVEKSYDILVILSGPEPQRSFLEDKIIEQLQDIEGNFMLVRGVDGEFSREPGFAYKGLAERRELEELIKTSRIVVSRSGYSSVMDYYFLGNKAMLIPTPGQAEQEYLANYLNNRKIFYSVAQRDLDLVEDLKKAVKYKGFTERESPERDWSSLFRLFQSK